MNTLWGILSFNFSIRSGSKAVRILLIRFIDASLLRPSVQLVCICVFYMLWAVLPVILPFTFKGIYY